MLPGNPRLLLLVYCLVNLLFFLTLERYRPVGEELLQNGDFSHGFQGWMVDGERQGLSFDNGTLSIDHPRTASTILSQCWPMARLPQPLLLSAESRGFAVVHGAKPWHEARIDLVGYDAQGQGLYQVRTRLLGLQGDRPWQTARGLFRVPARAERVCVEISLYATSGRFQVRHLSLFQGAEYPPYLVGRLSLLMGWILLAFWLAYRTLQHYRDRALGRWLAAMALLLLVGILLPHEWKQTLETGIASVLEQIGLTLPSPAGLATESAWSLWPGEWELSKYSHLLGFALLSALLFADRTLPWRRHAATLFLLAAATEIGQFFVPLRTPRLSDMVVDLLGVAIGFGVSALYTWLARRYAAGRI